MKLIAGIDPGTTVGWAVINLRGEFVAAGSQKELDLDSLISVFTGLGRVIVVGSDKAKIPSFVHDAAAKLGARLVGPGQDARVEEKRVMTAGFSFVNSHEMDALAGALLASKKIQSLLNKVHHFLVREKKLGMFEDVAELVLKEEISIRAAVLLLTPKAAPEKEEKTEEKRRDDDIVRLYSALSRARKDNALLLQKNRQMQGRLLQIEKQLSAMKERAAGLVKPKTPAEIARIKDSQIQSLSQRLKNSLQTQGELARHVERLERVLLHQDRVPLLRLGRLGWEEVMRCRDLVSEGSIVFVDDANEMSGKAVQWLHQEGVQIVVCGRLPGIRARAQLPFACVPVEECELLNRIVLVKRDWLDKVRAERGVLSKIVEEYRKERLPGGS
jgi:hypothetical protein